MAAASRPRGWRGPASGSPCSSAGREFVTGEFPSRFPDLRSEMQVTGKRLRIGPPTGLYDVRFGEDMHVLVGCGLGGGSLINAGVALRPDPRVFRDPVWPGQIAAGRSARGGLCASRRWVRPARDPAAAERTSIQALLDASRGARPGAGRGAGGRELRGQRQSGRRRAARLHALRRLLRRLQRRRQEHRGADLSARRGAARRGDFHARKSAATSPRRGRALAACTSSGWMAPAAAQARRRARDGRHGGAGGGNAGLDRDPAALARARAWRCRIAWAAAFRPTATSSPSATAPSCRSTPSASGIRPRSTAWMSAPASRARSRSSTRHELANSLTIQEGVLPSALAPILPVLFVPNGRLLGALQSLISGVYKGPFAQPADVLRRLARQRVGAAGAGGRPRGAALARRPRTSRCIGGSTRRWRRWCTRAGGSYVKNPLAGTVMGHQPATAHPLGGCGMGRERGDGVVNHKCQVFDGRLAPARLPCTRGST